MVARYCICAILGATPDYGIGCKGRLPWGRIPLDMVNFHQVTQSTRLTGTQNAVVMGRRTWESIPDAVKPLKGRINVVLSRTLSNGDISGDVMLATSLNDAYQKLSEKFGYELETIYVIGGVEVYKEAIESGVTETIYWTRICKKFECDTYFPKDLLKFYEVVSISKSHSFNGIPFDFVTYQKKNFFIASHQSSNGEDRIAKIIACPSVKNREHGEFQYLDLIADILNNGVLKGDRTGTGTYSIFGKQMRFDLRETFPLLTTKRIFWKGVVEELLWFIKGSTSAKELLERGVKIWEKNSTREFLDSLNLNHREEGDLGPVYGFQWRHFGAEYKDMHSDYTGKGVDQLLGCINKLKSNPDDRRIIMSAWNPIDLPKMALPPCHLMCQFYVANGELSCQLYQRSCDVGLGVPFNIASYSLLTCLMAQVCDLKPKEFIHTMGDTHIYLNHVEALKQQINREPFTFPVLQLNPEIKDIDKFTFSDINLLERVSHGKIDMKMAV